MENCLWPPGIHGSVYNGIPHAGQLSVEPMLVVAKRRGEILVLVSGAHYSFMKPSMRPVGIGGAMTPLGRHYHIPSTVTDSARERVPRAGIPVAIRRNEEREE